MPKTESNFWEINSVFDFFGNYILCFWEAMKILIMWSKLGRENNQVPKSKTHPTPEHCIPQDPEA